MSRRRNRLPWERNPFPLDYYFWSIIRWSALLLVVLIISFLAQHQEDAYLVVTCITCGPTS